MKKPVKKYEYEVKRIGETNLYKILRHTLIDGRLHRSKTLHKNLEKGHADDWCFRLENNLPLLTLK